MPTDLTLPLVPARCATDASVAQRFVLVIAMLLYCFTLRAGWAIDDKKAILNNPDIVGQQPAILSNDYWGMPMSSPKSHKSYRPITILSFKLDHSLVGLAPWFSLLEIQLDPRFQMFSQKTKPHCPLQSSAIRSPSILRRIA